MPTLESVTLIGESAVHTKDTRQGTRVYEAVVAVGDVGTVDSDQVPGLTDGTTTIPVIGTAWRVGSKLRVSTINVDLEGGDNRTHIARVSYAVNDQLDDENPLNRDPVIRWSGISESETYFTDVDGNAVINSAGQVFDQDPERDKAQGVRCSISSNQATSRVNTLQNAHKLISNGVVTIAGVGFTAGQVRLDDFSISEAKTVTLSSGSDVTYYEETIELSMRPTFEDEFEDRGTKNISDEKKQDDDGLPSLDQWPLDGAGEFKTNKDDNPATFTRKPYSATSFSFLPS